MANFFLVNGKKDWNMPFQILPLLFLRCVIYKECRKGKMGTWLDPTGVIHDLWLELAALLGFPHTYSLLNKSLGKRIRLVLANNLIHYLSSSLQHKLQLFGVRSHGPIPSLPPRRNSEITPAGLPSFLVVMRPRVTDRP